jgi:hypothetical protein
MRLNRGQLPSISRAIVNALVSAEAIEVGTRREVERDVESVLQGYLNQTDQVQSRARDLVQQRGLPQGEFGRIKQLCADQEGVKVGEDGLDYVLEQILQMLMHSGNVEEVFAEDHQLKRHMRPFLREEEGKDDQIEAEVRRKLKHVKEGSRLWEIEYNRMKEEIMRRRGVS